jgi:Type II restriction endonuclease, TdeIII
MAFPRHDITDRLNANVDKLVSTIGGGRAARSLFLAEVYSPGDSGNSSPFLKTLFPEVKIAATIERSLQTALGRGWDHMAADIARAAHGNAETNYSVTGAIPVVTANQIESIVASYTTGTGHATPNTQAELKLILPGVASPGPTDNVHEKDDVFFTSSDGFENHIEIKTPKPNYDQGRASKRRILRILAARSAVDVRAFVGMPYNPNGSLGEYSWPTTKYMIDISIDLKVGRDFWNYVGDSSDTYEELLDCFLEVASVRKHDLLDLLREV